MKNTEDYSQISLARVSTGSEPVYNIDVPEVSSISVPSCEFVYNYYVVDERLDVSPDFQYFTPDGEVAVSFDKIPRYVKVTWEAPNLSDFQISEKEISERKTSGKSISASDAIIVGEEDMTAFLSDTFFDYTDITQASTDLENYSYLSMSDAESVTKMATNIIRDHAYEAVSSLDENMLSQVVDLADAYRELSNNPKESLGLSVFNIESKNLADRDSIDKEITRDNLKMRAKINSLLLADVYANARIKKTTQGIVSLNESISQAKTMLGKSDLRVVPVDRPRLSGPVNSVAILGYKIERYKCRRDGSKEKDGTFFVENPKQTSFIDKGVSYGNTYLYSIKTVASVIIYPLEIVDGKPKACFPVELYISSKPSYTNVECHEYVPPPPPVDIGFVYSRYHGNLIIDWSMPVNPQNDIKQFQVFRRKTTKEPFELIAQYNFDNSLPGGDFNSLFTTGEFVDANNPFLDQTWASLLIKKVEEPVFRHVDEDFVFDSEFFQTQPYIYAICSIDAHGMISNYSSQYMVDFDPYKNQLVVRLICDPGSPRQYPNMFLRMDAFKDAIKVAGVDTKKLKIAFTPEYFRLYKKQGKKNKQQFNVVEAVTPGRKDNPYYLLQIINLDNQKMQSVKIKIDDPDMITKK